MSRRSRSRSPASCQQCPGSSPAYLERRDFPGRGFGVVTQRAFAPGETVVEGELGPLEHEPASHNSQLSEHVWVQHGGIIPSINHSCDPNCGFKINKMGAHDVICRKPLVAGDEVTVDYAMRNYWIKFMPNCLCGSPLCRKKITGWKDLPYDRREDYRSFSVPYVWRLSEQDRARKILAEERDKITKMCRCLRCCTPDLVVASSGMPHHVVKGLYERGQLRFGEHCLEELREKADRMPPDVLWHFLGKLPSAANLIKLVAIRNLHLIEIVGTAEQADLLQVACAHVSRTKLGILLHVNDPGDAMPGGVPAAGFVALASHVLNNCPFLELMGFMTAAPARAEAVEQHIEQINEHKAQLCGIHGMPSAEELVIRMGTSADCSAAIRCGSTCLQVDAGSFNA